MHISTRWIRQVCNTLQLTATHHSAPKHTATRCNTLQRTATHLNTLPKTARDHHLTCNGNGKYATHCNSLQNSATHCNALQQTILVRWNWQGNPLRLVFRMPQSCLSLQHTATHYITLQHTTSCIPHASIMSIVLYSACLSTWRASHPKSLTSCRRFGGKQTLVHDSVCLSIISYVYPSFLSYIIPYVYRHGAVR